MTVQLSRCLYFRLRARQHLTRIGVFPLQFFTSFKKKPLNLIIIILKSQCMHFFCFVGAHIWNRGEQRG